MFLTYNDFLISKPVTDVAQEVRGSALLCEFIRVRSFGGILSSVH